MTMTPMQEDVGMRLMEMLSAEGQNLSVVDGLMLRSAWKGKLRWNELPDHLRSAFFRVAVQITGFINSSNALPPGR